MRDVAIIGVGIIPFGRRDEDSLMDMLAYASLNALDDAGLGGAEHPVDAVYVGNMGGGIIQHQTSIASSLVDRLSLLPAAAETVENGPASGGSAVKNGLLAVASGYYDSVLVVGGEKMREVTGWRATDFVATMTHPQVEYPYGITLPGLAGMFTRLYMEKYGVTREQLVAISIKNQAMGTLNPYAHVEMALSREGIFESPHSVVNNPPVADPLHLYDACPVSDGAAALVLCPLEMVKKANKPPGRHRRLWASNRHADFARTRRPHRFESGHTGCRTSLRASQTQAWQKLTWLSCMTLSPSWRSPKANTSGSLKRAKVGRPPWQERRAWEARYRSICPEA